MRIQFGAGQIFLRPIGGNIPTNATPQILATLQDFAIDISATIKDLRGQFQFPDDTAISDRKITWKSGSGRMDIDAYNQLCFGESSIGTGGTPQSVQESHTIPATNPTTVTVTLVADIPITDLGVQYSATGQKLTAVPSGPVAGQYSVNPATGVYTFALADASKAVLISYNYVLTTGRILTVNNHVQGFGPALEIFASMPYQELTAGVPNYIHLYNAKVSKLGIPLKRADYLITDLEGEAYANAAGAVADFYED
jgi:hypothetical protein